MTFDPLDPPQTYKDFKREILKSVAEADVESDEEYDLALFTVDRENNGAVVEIEDLLEEFDEDTEMQDIVEFALPDIVKKNNSKFFAFVFPGFEITSEGAGDEELVCVLIGALFEMHLTVSEVHRDEGEMYAELGPWTSHDPNDYPQLTLPFRKSITYQES